MKERQYISQSKKTYFTNDQSIQFSQVTIPVDKPLVVEGSEPDFSLTSFSEELGL